MRTVFAAFAAGLALMGAAFAAEPPPDERLADPALEARAEAITHQLRCMVCQSESVDESDADLARDIRLLVRERLKAGDTDKEIFAYLVDHYGEFILMKPRFSWRNAALWLGPGVVLALGGVLAFAFVRGQRAGVTVPPLTEEEERALVLAARDEDDGEEGRPIPPEAR